MGIKPSCLDTLTVDTRTWAECTHTFSRNDNRCKPSTAKMAGSMKLCKKKGYSKKQIDAAMAKGAQTAGRPQKQQPAPAPAPNPRPAAGPIPHLDPPREGRDDGNHTRDEHRDSEHRDSPRHEP